MPRGESPPERTLWPKSGTEARGPDPARKPAAQVWASGLRVLNRHATGTDTHSHRNHPRRSGPLGTRCGADSDWTRAARLAGPVRGNEEQGLIVARPRSWLAVSAGQLRSRALPVYVARLPKTADPTLTIVAPSSMATSRSPLIPIESSSILTPSRLSCLT